MAKQGPRPLVICGPSGSGKSTLLKKLFKEFPNTFGFRYFDNDFDFDFNFI